MMSYIVEKRQIDSFEVENVSDGVDHPSYGSQSDDRDSVEDPKEKLIPDVVNTEAKREKKRATKVSSLES